MFSVPTFIGVCGDVVELWFHSPSGDSSDSQIFRMHCRSESQAKLVAQEWATTTGTVWHDSCNRMWNPRESFVLACDVIA